MCQRERKAHLEEEERKPGPLLTAPRGPPAGEVELEFPVKALPKEPDHRPQLYDPRALRASERGLLIADGGNSRILEVVDGCARVLAEGVGVQGKKDEDGFHVDSEDLLKPMDMVAFGDILLVVDTGRCRILGYTGFSKGKLSAPETVLQPGGRRGKSSPEGLKFPRGICLTKKAVYLVDSWSHRLLRLRLPEAGSEDLEDLALLASHFEAAIETVFGGGMPGGGLDKMRFPTDVLVEKDDADSGAETLLVSDTGNHRVLRLTYSGKDVSPKVEVVCGTGSAGVGPHELDSPACLALDKDGALFVADTDNQRVQRFPTVGAKEGVTVCSGSAPWGLLMVKGVLHVTDLQSPCLLAVEAQQRKADKGKADKDSRVSDLD
jgi:hypothetical protein